MTRSEEKVCLLEAAEILTKLSREVQGEAWFVLNNSLGHVLGRFYENGLTFSEIKG